uniref:Uncharacterized protein n=1 Tax=Chromera velia CCMP2878 TaxID=1169474 RepID=A0A0G4ID71_9ALVE|mmetsp:Transcript_38643/g.75925  ORF Transcript_38643/g.75925 Transcript_38643/m.75925 type:complete len:180 (+) Transcript_38643:342-881(+)|eukprot:Cvel_13296.t1-p1 / transcript=Cvel_13296.t1 / gene=Cvel_13296 / organism=Chromera_velia_CCMP2878 / gene_product=hypothetical protein / transcript_product=hypothetical protein / location=Cvel_scaffold902:26040-28190(+) / protein_length=179 / sequence_SO=supercontig / SO=protein_coding / is_pseudo=false
MTSAYENGREGWDGCRDAMGTRILADIGSRDQLETGRNMMLSVLADEEPFDETRTAASAASLRDVGAGLDLPAFGSGAMLQLEGGETEVIMIESDVGSFPPSTTRERASSAAAVADPSLSVSLSMHQAAGAAALAAAGAASGPPSASQGRNGAGRLHLLSEPLPVAPSQTDAQGRGGQS